MRKNMRTRGASLVVTGAALALVIAGLASRVDVAAQQAPAAPNFQTAAPIDMTGVWVSVVTEDWRWRMVTPPKGDYASVPINAEGRRVADTWDPAKDTAAGLQCRSYGAAGVMSVPARLTIAWQDTNTLKMDIDNGKQTRLFHFNDVAAPAGADAGWQGFSTAAWELFGNARGGGGGGGGAAGGRGGPTPQQRGGDLKVETTKMRPGYLRKNGVPYSDKATMTEYFDRHTEPNGDQWLTVTTIVKDPLYLNGDYITSRHFKKEPDASKVRPQDCVAQ